jgi:spore germination cell wall hydrolase CwlJ-like protein
MSVQSNLTAALKGAPDRLKRLFEADPGLHLARLELCVVLAVGASLAMAAHPAQPHERLARLTEGDISSQAFARLTASMDPAMLSLAVRFEQNAMLDDDQGRLQQVSYTPDGPTAADSSVIRLQDLSPEAARIWNQLNPVTAKSNVAAQPFKLNASGVMDEARAVDCLTAAVYYEAAMESTDGQRAVAQVVLNRMRHPAFPKTVCGVVFQGSNRQTGCQFSFTCDGSLGRKPSEAGWARARQVAVAALNGYVMKAVGTATHYHANYVAPYWSPSLVKIGAIGAHIFYRWTGTWGLPPAFGGAYAGGEMNGLQVATLDGLNNTGSQLDMTSASEITAPVVSETVVEAAHPGSNGDGKGADSAAGAEIVTAAQAGVDAIELTKPEDLDWAGRPKAKSAPRVALP